MVMSKPRRRKGDSGRRKFGGKTYYAHKDFARAGDASRAAESLRRQGHKARVVDGRGGSVVYIDKPSRNVWDPAKRVFRRHISD